MQPSKFNIKLVKRMTFGIKTIKFIQDEGIYFEKVDRNNIKVTTDADEFNLIRRVNDQFEAVLSISLNGQRIHDEVISDDIRREINASWHGFQNKAFEQLENNAVCTRQHNKITIESIKKQ